MDCSIVIRAYNEAQHLDRLFQGIKSQTIKDVEVILVDSGSTDSTVSIAQSHEARIVRIAPADFTFGRSLNLGIQAAACELVVIASAHVYPVYPDWLESLLAPFQEPRIALAYGKQRGPASARFSEQQVFARWYSEAPDPHQAGPFCNPDAPRNARIQFGQPDHQAFTRLSRSARNNSYWRGLSTSIPASA